MTSLYVNLDSSLEYFAREADYKEIGLDASGHAYLLGDESISLDLPNMVVIFSQCLTDYQELKDNYIDICEKFYMRAVEFHAAKANLEAQKKRLDFVVCLLQSRQAIFSPHADNQEVYAKFTSYLQKEFAETIHDIYPLERALNHVKALQSKRTSVNLQHSLSASSLVVPESPLAPFSDPLAEVAEEITFVSADRTQYSFEEGTYACSTIALQAIVQLFSDPDMSHITSEWMTQVIDKGVQAHSIFMKEKRQAALGFGCDGTRIQDGPLTLEEAKSTYPSLSLAKSAEHFRVVSYQTILEGLSFLEDAAKGGHEHSCGGVLTSNEKSYAIKVDFDPVKEASSAILVDSHGYRFEKFPNQAYACRFPNLESLGAYLSKLLKPNMDGSQRSALFSMTSVMMKRA